MSEITTDREAAAKQLASDAVKVWRYLSPTEKDEFRREAQKRIDRDGGVRIHPSEDETDVAAYVSVSARDTLDDLSVVVAAASGDAGNYTAEQLERVGLPGDPDMPGDDAQETLYALPLSVDRTVCFEVVLGIGGPDRRIVVECDAVDSRVLERGENVLQSVGYEIRRVLYRYSWSGSAELELSGTDRETAEAFARQVVPELVE
jgi:hypothetical protein